MSSSFNYTAFIRQASKALARKGMYAYTYLSPLVDSIIAWNPPDHVIAGIDAWWEEHLTEFDVQFLRRTFDLASPQTMADTLRQLGGNPSSGSGTFSRIFRTMIEGEFGESPLSVLFLGSLAGVEFAEYSPLYVVSPSVQPAPVSDALSSLMFVLHRSLVDNTPFLETLKNIAYSYDSAVLGFFPVMGIGVGPHAASRLRKDGLSLTIASLMDAKSPATEGIVGQPALERLQFILDAPSADLDTLRMSYASLVGVPGGIG